MTHGLPDAGSLRGHVVAPHELSDDERKLWRQFCNAPAFAHPFYSLAFAECVARVRPHVRVCVLERENGIDGFFPFQFAGRWERVLGAAEPVGGYMSDCFGVIARPATRFSPSELLAAADLKVIAFHHLVEDQHRFGLSGEQPRIGHRIMIGGDPADYWERLKSSNKRFVAEIGRRRRKIVETLGSLRLKTSSGDTAAELKELIALKRRQYRETRASDALAQPWKRALLLELARGCDPACSGVLSELYAGDTWVASHFGLRNRDTLHYWFPIYNAELAKFAPGHLLISQILDESSAMGIRIIDRGEGDQPHKTMWLTEPHTFYRGLWYRAGARSFIHRLQFAATWRLRAWTQRLCRHSDGAEE
jgi:CelD/BcsL family acetyltransferase involved in cellulose biosynthesis